MGYAGHDLPKETFTEYLLRTTSRGPDDQRVAETEFGLLGFGRLAIMGLTPEGMQPFFRGADCVTCNANCTASAPQGRSGGRGLHVRVRLRLRDTSCRSTTSTALTCSGTSTPSSHDPVRQPQKAADRRT